MTPKILYVTFLSAALSSSASLAEPEKAICAQLAAQAPRIPADKWVNTVSDPMDALWKGQALGETGRALSAIEQRLVSDPQIRDALYALPEAPLSIERLPGTHIYRIDSFQGTANCQSMVFVDAPPGRAVKRIAAPSSPTPCTTEFGRFGEAFGRPIFVVGGATSMRGLARSYSISAWRGTKWAPACQLTVGFTSTFKVTGRFCTGEKDFCDSAADMASTLAAAYDRTPTLDRLALVNGAPPPEAVTTQLAALGEKPPEFPTFGLANRQTENLFFTSFSNAQDPARVALRVDQHWMLGVVGIAGVGWRESTTTLVVIHGLNAEGWGPVASFQVEKLPTGRPTVRWW